MIDLDNISRYLTFRMIRMCDIVSTVQSHRKHYDPKCIVSNLEIILESCHVSHGVYLAALCYHGVGGGVLSRVASWRKEDRIKSMHTVADANLLKLKLLV